MTVIQKHKSIEMGVNAVREIFCVSGSLFLLITKLFKLSLLLVSMSYILKCVAFLFIQFAHKKVIILLLFLGCAMYHEAKETIKSPFQIVLVYILHYCQNYAFILYIIDVKLYS